MGYLTHKEKSLLFSALTREEIVCKENGFEELVPVVKSLEGKFYYDRFEKDIRNKAIDEFVEAFKKSNITSKVFERIFHMIQFAENNFHGVTSDIDNMYCELADEIAEQMKGGAE